MILHHIQPRTYVGSTANQICLFFVHSVCYHLKSAALTCLDMNFYFLHFLLSYTPFLDSQVMTPRTTIVKIMTSLHSSRTSYFVPTSRWWLFASCVLLEWAAIRCSRDVRRHQSEPLESTFSQNDDLPGLYVYHVQSRTDDVLGEYPHPRLCQGYVAIHRAWPCIWMWIQTGPWRAHVPVDTAFYLWYRTFGKESSIGHAVTSLIFFFAKTRNHVSNLQ